MKTIYRDNAERVTVADAKRLILDANPTKGNVAIFAEVDEQGEATGSIQVKHHVPIESDFLEICDGLGIRPRMQHSPAVMAYRGTGGQDSIYTIAHDEFAKIALLFDVLVCTGVAPEHKTLAPISTTVVVQSTMARGNHLKPIIEHAQSQCRNPQDAAEVWAALQVLASHKSAPLFGEVEEGLQYNKDGYPAILSRKALGQRLARKARL